LNNAFNGFTSQDVINDLKYTQNLKSDYTILYVGINDVSTLFYNNKKPKITTEQYKNNMKEIIMNFKNSKVAVVSIHHFLQNLNSEINQKVLEFNKELKNITMKYDHVTYIPFGEKLIEIIKDFEKNGIKRNEVHKLVFDFEKLFKNGKNEQFEIVTVDKDVNDKKSILWFFLLNNLKKLFYSFDDISIQNNLLFTYDGIHINNNSVNVLFDLISNNFLN
jgi:hypothetical protein